MIFIDVSYLRHSLQQTFWRHLLFASAAFLELQLCRVNCTAV